MERLQRSFADSVDLNVDGSRTRAKIVRIKAAPFREAEFDIIYGEGISREGDLIWYRSGLRCTGKERYGCQLWYRAYGGQGRENARTFMKENKDVRDKLELALRKKLEIAIPVNSNSAEPAKSGFLTRVRVLSPFSHCQSCSSLHRNRRTAPGKWCHLSRWRPGLGSNPLPL